MALGVTAQTIDPKLLDLAVVVEKPKALPARTNLLSVNVLRLLQSFGRSLISSDRSDSLQKMPLQVDFPAFKDYSCYYHLKKLILTPMNNYETESDWLLSSRVLPLVSP
ncbi:hypothetical protein ES703_67477 [subsurface metagenome]